MALQFAEHPPVRYQRAPLSMVLCQLRFSPIFALATQIGITGFQEAIRAHYPQTDAETDTQVAFSPQQLNVQQAAPTWRFTSADGNWRVGLGVDFVALETPRYTEFEDFYDRFEGILAVLERTVHPGVAKRIGLRKINEIHQKVSAPHDWQEFVRPELLGALAVSTYPVPVAFGFSDLRFEDGSNQLAVRHGLHPKEANTYVLDMDYWTEVEYEIAPSPELSKLFHRFSSGMTSFFHWMAQPRLLEQFGPYPKSGGTSE